MKSHALIYVLALAFAAVLPLNFVLSSIVVPGAHIHPIGHSIKNQLESSNWGGYVVASSQIALDNPGNASDEALASHAVTSAYGSWIVQAVNGTGTTYSAQWVGIGGYFGNDSTLIQTGTSSDTSKKGQSYNAWYEMLPNSEVAISGVTVHPGDRINASITCTAQCNSSAQEWRITLADVSDGQSFTTNASYSSKLLSAEWIDERPELCSFFGCSLSTLADYVKAYYGFDYSSLTGTEFATFGTSNSLTQAFALFPHENVTMVETGGGSSTVYSVPSAPSTDSTSFTMAYVSASSTTSTTTTSSSTTTTTNSTSTTTASTSTTSTSTTSISTTTTTICPRFNPHGKCIGKYSNQKK